jgi:hypothetical protein
MIDSNKLVKCSNSSQLSNNLGTPVELRSRRRLRHPSNLHKHLSIINSLLFPTMGFLPTTNPRRNSNPFRMDRLLVTTGSHPTCWRHFKCPPQFLVRVGTNRCLEDMECHRLQVPLRLMDNLRTK